MMSPSEYIEAARVPLGLKPQAFGPWHIERVGIEEIAERTKKLGSFTAQARLAFAQRAIGFSSYTLLKRYSYATMHLNDPYEVVMEDSTQELQKHLPIWLRATGRVLVTGLGLGCVVRGLLAKPAVEKITVVEIDRGILRVIGHEFASNPRVELIEGNALTFQPNGHHWDCAWHDLWTDGPENLQCLHARLINKFYKSCDAQGAWQFPRYLKKRFWKNGIKWILG